MTRRGVFLDRDGVLNRAIVRDGKPYPPANLGELEILPDSAAACRDLHQAGFLLIVITNQPDVARGQQIRENVEAVNAMLQDVLPLDDIKVCYHDDSDNCECRKPKPGLVLKAAEEWNIDLLNSFVIGDRWKDIAAGSSAGCKTIFIDRNYSERPPQDFDVKVNSLNEAAGWILRVRD